MHTKFRSKVQPYLCFATGRGLSNSLIACPSYFRIYPISKNEKPLHPTNDISFQITFERIKQEKREIVDIPYEIYYEKHFQTVQFIIPKEGKYLISVTHRNEDICFSPFELTTIKMDQSPSSIRKMAFTEWEREIASLLLKYSESIDDHEKIFEVGVSVLLHLQSSAVDSIQQDISTALSNLLRNEESKLRLTKDGGVDFIKQLMTNLFWLSDENLCLYVSKMVNFWLDFNKNFAMKYIEQVGIESLISLSQVNCKEVRRYVAKAFLVLSNIDDNRTSLLAIPFFLDSILALIEYDDNYTQDYILQLLRNLTSSRTIFIIIIIIIIIIIYYYYYTDL